MKENESAQLELFNEGGGEDRRSAAPNSFLGFVRGYEKVAILLIIFIACAIVFYSLGVEKGKRLAAVIAPANPAAPVQVVKQEKPLIYPQPQDNLATTDKQKFTIQLASFKNRSAAMKEAEVLKNKGLQPLVLSKGSFLILCVGNFSNKNNANQTLSLLKKRYQDSYVRRL